MISRYPDDQPCLHQLVEEQVTRTPDAIAIEFAEEQLSYRELNARANQLAHHLIGLGVKPEVTVGLCLERSVAMLVGLLGILKAGGAYVPLDPTYPQERLAFLIADAEIGLVLTAGAFTVSTYKGQLLLIAPNATWLTSENRHNPTVPMTPDQLLYVLYTSGSTGTPKGVAMHHGALCNLITWQCTQSMAAPRTLQFAPLSFDVSCQEIFSTWCTGGTLVLVDEETRHDPSALLRLLGQAAVNRLFLPVVVLHQLAAAAQSENTVPTTLREVITAGEPLYLTPTVRHFFQRLPQTTLHNHYGPTETHVVTAFTLTGPVNDWPTLPPIGSPLANTQLYLLDDQGQPVPLGMAGELYIGGAGVARGYHKRPELTAERFVKNPFGAGKLYKTGDQAQRLATGDFAYLGRLDQQVKVRGFRVEVGEIEAVLRQHPLVQDAVVVAQTDTAPSGEKRLIAYLVTQANPQPATLRAYLAAKLPDYMIPTAFVPLAALPLTANGKVNRLALPAPTRDHRVDNTYRAPRTPIEEQLAAIWCTLLGVEAVGVYDNFFALGGHSLLATQVVAHIGQQFPVAFPLRCLFISPTIAEMALLITQLWAAMIDPIEVAALLTTVEQLPEEQLSRAVVPYR